MAIPTHAAVRRSGTRRRLKVVTADLTFDLATLAHRT